MICWQRFSIIIKSETYYLQSSNMRMKALLLERTSTSFPILHQEYICRYSLCHSWLQGHLDVKPLAFQTKQNRHPSIIKCACNYMCQQKLHLQMFSSAKIWEHLRSFPNMWSLKSRIWISITSTKHILLLHFQGYPLSNLESFWHLHFRILKAFRS